jgi:hypothetical protein
LKAYQGTKGERRGKKKRKKEKGDRQESGYETD